MEFYESPKQINGINLADYYLDRRSYNSVVYVHKKCLEKPNKEKKKEKSKKDKEKLGKKRQKKIKCDKCEQCTGLDGLVYNSGAVDINNPQIAQRLQYANTLVPIILPPSGIGSPIYYTIKASKKKDNKKKSHVNPINEASAHTHILKKEKSKKVMETYRNNAGKESLSVKETITSYSHSSQNDTLNELHIQPSLSCSFSEISEHKKVRKEKRDKQKGETQKLVPSESFEALATEFLNISGDTKIKIHLMNETEKNLLSENIRVPILNAIRECIAEMNHQKTDAEGEVTTVKRFVKCNTEKLDHIIDKLTCIEQKFDQYLNTEKKKAEHVSSIRSDIRKEVTKTAKMTKTRSPRVQSNAASTLEQLGQDITELSQQNPLLGLEIDESSGEDYFSQNNLSARKRATAKSYGLQTEVKNPIDDKYVSGDGEEGMVCNTASNHQLIRPDRLSKIPARFCWTDAKKPTN